MRMRGVVLRGPATGHRHARESVPGPEEGSRLRMLLDPPAPARPPIQARRGRPASHPFPDAVEREAKRLGQQKVEERGERGGERGVEAEGVARAAVVEEREGGGDEEGEGEGQRHQPADELRAVARRQ